MQLTAVMNYLFIILGVDIAAVIIMYLLCKLVLGIMSGEPIVLL